jgi:hypothetical protein
MGEVVFSGGWIPAEDVEGYETAEGQWNVANAELLFTAESRKVTLQVKLRGAGANANQYPAAFSFRAWELVENDLDGQIEHQTLVDGSVRMEPSGSGFEVMEIPLDFGEPRKRNIRLELNTPTWRTRNSRSGETIWVGYQFLRCQLYE